jgi:hypothetical protein
VFNNVYRVFQEELFQGGEEKAAGDAEKPIGYKCVIALEKRPPVVDHIEEYQETKDKPQNFGWIERYAIHISSPFAAHSIQYSRGKKPFFTMLNAVISDLRSVKAKDLCRNDVKYEIQLNVEYRMRIYTSALYTLH